MQPLPVYSRVLLYLTKQFFPRTGASFFDLAHHLEARINGICLNPLEVDPGDASLFGEPLLGHFEPHSFAVNALTKCLQGNGNRSLNPSTHVHTTVCFFFRLPKRRRLRFRHETIHHYRASHPSIRWDYRHRNWSLPSQGW